MESDIIKKGDYRDWQSWGMTSKKQIIIEFNNSRESFYIHLSLRLLCFKVTVIEQKLIAKNLIAQMNYENLEFSL